jgi:crotonobetainyl-CoA:carnitine CoA-transferase CaiB-like acyl-CoA transferase
MSDGLLSGFVVTEVANYIAAPAAGAILAGLGARVIHVEPVAGDPYRGFRLGLSGFGAMEGGEDLAFRVDNRGKESLALDLRSSETRGIMRRLLSRSDVLITNLGTPHLKRMGLDPLTIEQAYPKLVYARINGYGFEGPDAEAESFDLGAFWARSGLLEGLAFGETLPQPRPGVGDHATAISLVAAIAISLLTRERTGKAPEARTSLLDTAMWMNCLDIAGAAYYGKSPEHRQGGSVPLIAAYYTADGRRLYLQVTHDAGWRALCEAVEHPEWAVDERFQGLGRRHKNAADLQGLLTSTLATRTLAEWQRIFREHGVPAATVNAALDLLDDEQVEANRHLAVTRSDDETVAIVGAPFEVGERPAEAEPSPAPGHGEHGELILLELGYRWEQIAALRERGALGPA